MSAAATPRPITAFEAARFTSAPLRLEGSAELTASQPRVFQLVSEELEAWLPMLQSARADHGSSANAGQCSTGTQRHCTFGGGMGDVDERIVWWNAPNGYAFTFAARRKMMMPTRDHVNLFTVDARGGARSTFTWRVYFNWEGVLMRHMSRLMMPGMLTDALKSLAKLTGGEAGAFRWVD